MTVGIVGLGLIGGSVGLALRDPGRRVLGVDPDPEHERIAKLRFCVDDLAPLDDVAKADLVFVCVPPAALADTLEKVRAAAGPETVFTDVTSVKATAVAWARATKESRFVPGHPMAGHEKGGPALASAWLFRNARWILTPVKTTARPALKSVEEAIKLMGGLPVRLEPEAHDGAVALLSHLPHAVAGSLVRMADGREGLDVAAGSWRDLTRVGGAEPDLWTQIFLENREALSREIVALEGALADLRNLLDTDDRDGVRAWLTEAQAAKKRAEPEPVATTKTVARGRSGIAREARK